MAEPQHRIQLLAGADIVLAVLLRRADIVSDEPFNFLPDVVHILQHIFRGFAAVSPLLKLHFHQPTYAAEPCQFAVMRTEQCLQRFALQRGFIGDTACDTPLACHDCLADLVIAPLPKLPHTHAEIGILGVRSKFIADAGKFAAQHKLRLLIIEPTFIEYAELIGL